MVKIKLLKNCKKAIFSSVAIPPIVLIFQFKFKFCSVILLYIITHNFFPGATCVPNEIYHHFDITTNASSFNQNKTCSTISKTFVLVTNITDRLKRNIMEFAPHVSSEKDVKTLLDYVNWELFVHTCEKSLCNYISNQKLRSQNLCLINASCCWSNAYEAVVSISRRCENSNCTDFFKTSAISHWYIFFVFGIICLSGNFVVIYQKVADFCKNQNQQKNILIYNILVLNLSIANLLMGIYLTSISLEIKRKLINENIYFSNHDFCNFLGVISTVSTQTSISVLAVISFCRLASLTFPYKEQRVKVVVGIVVLTWLIWLIVALLPTIPLEPLVTMFTFGISKSRTITTGSLNSFEITVPLIEELKFLLSGSKYKEINLVLEAITKYPTRSVLSKIHDRFGWIDLDTDDWFYASYYNLNYICTSNFFVDGMHINKFDYFSLSFVVINLAVSIAIMIAYVFISFTVSGNEKIACIVCKWCRSKDKNQRLSYRTHCNAVRVIENHSIFKHISIIIITDLFFVTPLSLAALVLFLSPSNVTGSDVLKRLANVQTLLLFVIPFNSIINPYIYSFTFWKNCFLNIKLKLFKQSAS